MDRARFLVVVDGDAGLAEMVRLNVGQLPYEVLSIVGSPEDALRLTQELEPELILIKPTLKER